MEEHIIRSIPMRSKKGSKYEIKIYGPGVAQVQLITFTQRPIWTIATTTNGYNGKYEPMPLQTDEVVQLLKDIQSTKNQTPLEMVTMLWLLTDVSRAFTHQLVRYRIGTTFVQESMRFLGLQNTYKVLATHMDHIDFALYMESIVKSISSYVDLVENGVAPEDARGIIPTNILTKIFFNVSLRALLHIIPQRLCCQAQQGEWQPILREMRKQIGAQMGNEIVQLLKAPYELGQPCGFRASFDRPCIWQKKEK